jgi:hypothetical protein
MLQQILPCFEFTGVDDAELDACSVKARALGALDCAVLRYDEVHQCMGGVE